MITDTGDKIDYSMHKVTLVMDEDSLIARKSVVRSSIQDQIELMHIMSQREFAALEMPHIRRRHFSGTNMGTKIGDVILPGYASLWSMACKAKHDLMGKYRVAVGGRTEGEEGPGRGQTRKTPDTVEPVFWHGRPATLYQELLHSYRLGRVVDLTAGDGELALQCAKRRVPYVGFTLTSDHSAHLNSHLVQKLMESKLNEKDPPCTTPSSRRWDRRNGRTHPSRKRPSRGQRCLPVRTRSLRTQRMRRHTRRRATCGIDGLWHCGGMCPHV